MPTTLMGPFAQVLRESFFLILRFLSTCLYLLLPDIKSCDSWTSPVSRARDSLP